MQESLEILYATWEKLLQTPNKTTPERGLMGNLFTILIQYGGSSYRQKTKKAQVEAQLTQKKSPTKNLAIGTPSSQQTETQEEERLEMNQQEENQNEQQESQAHQQSEAGNDHAAVKEKGKPGRPARK